MPVINAHILKGRPAEIKRRLAAALTTAMCDALDLEPKSVHVIIEEHERENWAMGGELFSDRSSSPKAAAEIDLDNLFKKPAPEKAKPQTPKPAAKAPPRKPPAKSRSRR
jgi:4-oxalocrotonate tautomerase